MGRAVERHLGKFHAGAELPLGSSATGLKWPLNGSARVRNVVCGGWCFWAAVCGIARRGVLFGLLAASSLSRELVYGRWGRGRALCCVGTARRPARGACPGSLMELADQEEMGRSLAPFQGACRGAVQARPAGRVGQTRRNCWQPPEGGFSRFGFSLLGTAHPP